MWPARYPGTHRAGRPAALSPTNSLASLTPFRVACPFSTSQPILTPDVANTTQSCGHISAQPGGGSVLSSAALPPGPRCTRQWEQGGRQRLWPLGCSSPSPEQCGRGTGPSLYHGAVGHLPSWSLSLPVSHSRFMDCKFQKTLPRGLGQGAPRDPRQREQLAHRGQGEGGEQG